MNPVINGSSHKVENDLLSGYSIEDFSAFIEKLEEHTNLLDSEGTTSETWHKILGTKFPKSTTVNNSFALANVQMCVNVDTVSAQIGQCNVAEQHLF